MWPFKKKEKKEFLTPKQLLDIKLKLDKGKRIYNCPDQTCLCFTCPSRGMCCAEKDVRMSGACGAMQGPRVVECSWNKNLKGVFNAKKEDTTGRGTPTTSGDVRRPEEVFTRGGR